MDKKFLLIIIAGLMVAETCEALLDKQPATHTSLVASPSHGKPTGRMLRDDTPCVPPQGTWTAHCRDAYWDEFHYGGKSCKLGARCWSDSHELKLPSVVAYNPGDYVINCNGQLTVGSQCP